jgi:biopolymer transport protein ExbD
MSELRRKHREINAELNLTTFIDLLSTIVCFLLISAVWIQVGALEIKQSHGTAGASTSKKESYELELKYVNKKSANIVIKRDGKRFRRYRLKEESPEALIKKIDSTLDGWMQSKSGKRGKIETAMITPKREVTYGEMVLALDALRKYKIVNIGVVPTKGEI